MRHDHDAGCLLFSVYIYKFILLLYILLFLMSLELKAIFCLSHHQYNIFHQFECSFELKLILIQEND
jgi:hypothetical protein